jgi:hypothetical protein
MITVSQLQLLVAVTAVVVTVLLFALGQLVVFVFGYGKLKQWTIDFEKRAISRWDKIERKVGLAATNGPGDFMPRLECDSRHGACISELEMIAERMTEAIADGKKAAEEGRNDRADLRRMVGQVESRLVHVETMLERKP